MENKCEWCGGNASSGESTVYWELPDGSRAIEITMTTAVICKECGMVYQTDNIIKEIEDQLFLVDTRIIGNSISFKELIELPRLLKRNYFDFSSK
ncbi:YokU family protein [Bacillus sp. 1NLA3E]|uniref:YokU family protein n=1 Tax=Bacillus sp. 1NLA3E TaxID=666686 RepID=UPI0005A039E9|nr:YokU family protein [Bacillus sp. 1NLA3E]